MELKTSLSFPTAVELKIEKTKVMPISGDRSHLFLQEIEAGIRHYYQPCGCSIAYAYGPWHCWKEAAKPGESSDDQAELAAFLAFFGDSGWVATPIFTQCREIPHLNLIFFHAASAKELLIPIGDGGIVGFEDIGLVKERLEKTAGFRCDLARCNKKLLVMVKE